MHPNENFSRRRVQIATHASPGSLPARTRTALAALGYDLVSPGPDAAASQPYVLRIVDDRLLEGIPSPAQDPSTPIVVLTDARSVPPTDARVVASARRPGQLEELFPILQSQLEGTPRRSPRTRVDLPARCVRADRRWLGAIVELSTTGCVVESHDWRTIGCLTPGSRMNLQFALPALDRDARTASGAATESIVTTRAECKQLDEKHAALEFCDASDDVRERLGKYVAATLSR